jgi:hypothetical protein
MIMPADSPTIVFIHGAWADVSGFDGSIRALRDQGFAVIGAANPLRHLAGDTASLAALLGSISGPIGSTGLSKGSVTVTLSFLGSITAASGS